MLGWIGHLVCKLLRRTTITVVNLSGPLSPDFALSTGRTPRGQSHQCTDQTLQVPTWRCMGPQMRPPTLETASAGNSATGPLSRSQSRLYSPVRQFISGSHSSTAGILGSTVSTESTMRLVASLTAAALSGLALGASRQSADVYILQASPQSSPDVPSLPKEVARHIFLQRACHQ
jgi:hypothetical protein